MAYSQLLGDLANDLHDAQSPLLADLALCGEDLIRILQASSRLCPSHAQDLDRLADTAHVHMRAAREGDPFAWRRLYTDALLVRCLADASAHAHLEEGPATECIERLDRILIVAGAPGEGRRDLVQALIALIQRDFLPCAPFSLEDADSSTLPEISSRPPPRVSAAMLPVPRLPDPPSIVAFQRRLHTPFILPGFARDWPALTTRPWRSLAYLRAAAGRGRVVPVEVGRDYRADDWTQRVMPWGDFLGALQGGEEDAVLYMAQHDVLGQFPGLMEDVEVPDYVYCAPEPPEGYPEYRPPGNEEQLVINGWLGPRGTVSPAHTVRRYSHKAPNLH
ncbi:Clavaminate synthase-like protein [Auriscalpium vulgare]|uniref:Clavaminate synthase-like protein n=1 Tax=Auriscalpium vulgare TaxID=40419 RepID=A0ACB8RLS0_9AGAM|nr:Clavaminate synthase-like protein [Auriscalpium vulgare]